MRALSTSVLGLCAVIASIPAWSGEESGPLQITMLRAYNGVTPTGGPGAVFVVVNQQSLCGTTVYRIEGDRSETLYAAALTALATGKPIRVEISNETGCTGWGTKLQSLYILSQ